jgi:hypothetical protein
MRRIGPHGNVLARSLEGLSHGITMSAASTFESIAGVRGCVVADTSGRVFEEVGPGDRGPELASGAAVVVAEFGRAGAHFGLGSLEVVTAQAATASWVVGARADWAIAVEMDPAHPTEAVESTLRTARWSSMLEWDEEEPQEAKEAGRDAGQEASAAANTDDFDPDEPPTYPFSESAIPIYCSVPPPNSAGDVPVFSGDLKMFPLVDLLEFLANARRTGTLACRIDDAHGTIQMRTGLVIAASCPKSDNLEDFLIKQGVTTVHELAAVAMANGRVTGRALALLLASREIIALTDVHTALEQQIRAALNEILSWTGGQFTFEPQPVGEPSALERELEFDVRGLLLEILRRQDEANDHG